MCALRSIYRIRRVLNHSLQGRCSSFQISKRSFSAALDQRKGLVSVDERWNEVAPQKEFHLLLSGESVQFDHFFLRDSCSGPCCVDPSTTQKLFQTTDIPKDIMVRKAVNLPGGGIQITWMNDLPHYTPENEHISVYDDAFFRNCTSRNQNRYLDHFFYGHSIPWSGKDFNIRRMPYGAFMDGDLNLYLALRALVYDGIIMIRDVPLSEESVEQIAKRIGNLRDTFYGRTWDVKSIPESKNVAYTSARLGLHMDLLYMKDPPGLQLLHCLQNTCEGGTAIFSDAFHAAKVASVPNCKRLKNMVTAYHYHNDNQYYFQEHPILEYTSRMGSILKHVNWSPPFQANYKLNTFGQTYASELKKCSDALMQFAARLEAPDHIYRHKYEAGDCVIFNNRRVVHGRESFDAEWGERWLKGAYVDTDVFHSRLRVLRAKVDIEKDTA